VIDRSRETISDRDVANVSCVARVTRRGKPSWHNRAALNLPRQCISVK
jgi:hypothetical protein